LESYGYTAEYQGEYIKLIYLRSRFLSPETGRFQTKDSWQGNYNRPLSLNRWNYVEGNPINSIDPSGYITEKESRRADVILGNLSRIYDIHIERDWGHLQDLVEGGTLYIDPPMNCEWVKGNWRSLEELDVVKGIIQDISKAIGGPNKFKAAFGSVDIGRIRLQNPPFAPPFVKGQIILTDLVFDHVPKYRYGQYVVVHEFGHIWDYRSGNQLSFGLMKKLGTWNCADSDIEGLDFACWTPSAASELPVDAQVDCKKFDNCFLPGNPYGYSLTYGIGRWATKAGAEDWATTFGYYVYPDGSFNSIGLGSIRRKYVKKQIANLP
jgi:RHS repeat-associated protein